MLTLPTAETWKALLRTPFGQQLAESVQQAEHAKTERETARMKLTELQTRMTKELPALQKAIKDGTAKIIKLTKEHQAAFSAEQTVIINSEAEIARLENQQSRIQAILRDTAAPAIRAFDRWLIDQLDVNRRSGQRQDGFDNEETTPGYLTKKLWYKSNQPAIEKRANAIKAAREALEPLQYEMLTDEQVAERIAKIKATIPAAGTLKELVKSYA